MSTDFWVFVIYNYNKFNSTRERKKFFGRFLNRNRNREKMITREGYRHAKRVWRWIGVKKKEHNKIKQNRPKPTKAGFSTVLKVSHGCKIWHLWRADRWATSANGRKTRIKTAMALLMGILILILRRMRCRQNGTRTVSSSQWHTGILSKGGRRDQKVLL